MDKPSIYMDSKISLVYMTYRPGGIDLLAESLKHQPRSLYELVVVDDYPGRTQRGEAEAYIRERGIPLAAYGPSKMRSYPHTRHGLANAMNSGALQASTDYVVFLHDFTWLPPGAIIQWHHSRQTQPPNTLLSGIASMRNSNSPVVDGDISIWRESYPEVLQNIYEETEEWVPQVFENFYCGVPVEYLERTNGLDERADSGHISWPYHSMVYQSKRHGYRLAVDRRLRCVMANHRKWIDKGAKQWHAEQMSDEKADMPAWRSVSPNPFDFRDLRRLTVEASGRELSQESTNSGLVVPNDRILGPSMRAGPYEPLETKLVKDYLNLGDVAFDIGAAVGHYTLACSHAVGPSGYVLAIEPEPSNADLLQANINRYGLGNVEVLRLAVGCSRSIANLYLSRDNAGDHRLWNGDGKRESIPVQVLTVDQVANGLPSVNLIKLDVQGSEMNVLQGAKTTIARQERMALAVEFWPQGLQASGSSPKEFLDLVEGLGFRLFWINEPKGQVEPTSRSKLASLISAGSPDFANLWCLKGEANG